MKVVLLSGGQGKRLWPISTDDIPKQFVELFEESKNMLTKTYENVSYYFPNKDIFVATCSKYKNEVIKNTNSRKNIIEEPALIGTFGAILNIAVHLKYNENVTDEEIVAVIPIDHYVDKDFYEILFKAQQEINNSGNDVCLIGIKPTYPSTQYGYILYNNNVVSKFVEKPNYTKAIELLMQKALWNSGIVLFKEKKIIEITKKYFNFTSYEEFINNYSSLPHTSFDYAFLEKEKNISIIKSDSLWEDLGTWEILSNKISNCDSYNTNIINFENKKIINNGCENIILINSKNGILILPKNKSFYKIENGFYEEVSKINTSNNKIKIIREILYPDKEIHFNKDIKEYWHIISGFGQLILDNEEKILQPRMIIEILNNKNYILKTKEILELLIIQYE